MAQQPRYPLPQAIASRLPTASYSELLARPHPSGVPCGLNPFNTQAAIPSRLQRVGQLMKDVFVNCVSNFLVPIPPIDSTNDYLVPIGRRGHPKFTHDGFNPDASHKSVKFPIPTEEDSTRNILPDHLNNTIYNTFTFTYMMSHNIIPAFSLYHRAINHARSLAPHLNNGVPSLSNDELFTRLQAEAEASRRTFQWKKSKFSEDGEDRGKYRVDNGKVYRPFDGFGYTVADHSLMTGYTWQPSASLPSSKGTKPKFHIAASPRWVLTTYELQCLVESRNINPLNAGPQAQIADALAIRLTQHCFTNKIRILAITNHEVWTFGFFSDDWTTLNLTPLIPLNSCPEESRPLVDNDHVHLAHLSDIPPFPVSILQCVLFMMDITHQLYLEQTSSAHDSIISQLADLFPPPTPFTGPPSAAEAILAPPLSPRSGKRKAKDDIDAPVSRKRQAVKRPINFIDDEVDNRPGPSSPKRKAEDEAGSTASSKKRKSAPASNKRKASDDDDDVVEVTTSPKKRKYVEEPAVPSIAVIARRAKIYKSKRSMIVSGRPVAIDDELYLDPASKVDQDDNQSISSVVTFGADDFATDDNKSPRAEISPLTPTESATVTPHSYTQSEGSIDDLPDHASVSSRLSSIDIQALEEPLPLPETTQDVVAGLPSPPPEPVPEIPVIVTPPSPAPQTDVPPPPTTLPSLDPEPTTAPEASTSTTPPLQPAPAAWYSGFVPITIDMFRGRGPVGTNLYAPQAVYEKQVEAKSTNFRIEHKMLIGPILEVPEVDMDLDGTFRAAAAIASRPLETETPPEPKGKGKRKGKGKAKGKGKGKAPETQDTPEFEEVPKPSKSKAKRATSKSKKATKSKAK